MLIFQKNIGNIIFLIHLKDAFILYYINDAYRVIICNKIKQFTFFLNFNLKWVREIFEAYWDLFSIK